VIEHSSTFQDIIQSLLPRLLTILASSMTVTSASDAFVLVLGVLLATLYLFRDQLFTSSKAKLIPINSVAKVVDGVENPRDFIMKMKAGVS
jgi:hypothetical protein